MLELDKNTKSNSVILLDSNALCHKAKHTMKELSSQEMAVGVIFGYLSQLISLAKEYNTDQIVHIWDSKKSLRANIFPAYKMKRKSGEGKTPEELEYDKVAYAQFDALYESIIPEMGFSNNFKCEGFEGDDIIASIIDNDDSTDFLIASGDEDLYQLLCPGVRIIKKKGLYDENSFVEEYGISPRQWHTVKAYAGCDTDEVPGLPGIGEKTAIKYINGEVKIGSETYKKFKAEGVDELVKRNLKLVTLPFENTPQFKIKRDNHLSLDGFCEVCKRYEFNHFLKKENLTKWKQYLNLR